MAELPCSPLFIIGSPRSGTTMLAGLLRQTPWGAPFETHYIPKYHAALSQFGDLTDRRSFSRLASRILEERPIKQCKLDVNPERLFDSLERHDYPSLVNAIGMAYGKRHGHSCWGDKTPDYIGHVALLHQLFPDSRMLYIVRDGRDVAMSLLEKSWGPANVYECARKWARENAPQPIIERLAQRRLLCSLRYEDLLEEPDETLDRIMAFLGQPGLPRNVTSGIREQNKDKWKRRMSGRQIETFDSVAGATLRRFGYEVGRERPPVSSIQKAGYTLHNAAKTARHLFRQNAVEPLLIRYFGKEPFAE